MKKHITKGLTLSRETVRTLGGAQLAKIAGGMRPESGCTACEPTHTMTCSCDVKCADTTTNDTHTCG